MCVSVCVVFCLVVFVFESFCFLLLTVSLLCLFAIGFNYVGWFGLVEFAGVCVLCLLLFVCV